MEAPSFIAVSICAGVPVLQSSRKDDWEKADRLEIHNMSRINAFFMIPPQKRLIV